MYNILRSKEQTSVGAPSGFEKCGLCSQATCAFFPFQIPMQYIPGQAETKNSAISDCDLQFP